MLNCIAPRSVIDLVKARFGSVFGSTAPDYNFAYRCLGQVDSILFYDKALLVHYALDRSNGASFATGRPSRDHTDFLQNLGSAPLNFAAPFPEVWTTDNTIFHEYCVVQQHTRSSKYPPLDLGKYSAHLEKEIEAIENRRVRKEMRVHLEARRMTGSREPDDRFRSPLRLLLRALMHLPRTVEGRAKRWYWAFLERRRDRLEELATGRRCEFRSVSDALHHASQSLRAPSSDSGATTLHLVPDFAPRFLSQARLPLDAAVPAARK